MPDTEKPTLVSVAKLYDQGEIDLETLKQSYRDIEFTPENHVVDGIEVDGEWDNSRTGLGEAVEKGFISEETGLEIFNDIMNDLSDEGKNVVPGVSFDGTPHAENRKAATKES